MRDAFDRWVSDQSRKGQKWRVSVRKQQGAVSKLYDQVGALSVRYPAPDTGGALAGVIAARDASIPVLFAGAQCMAHGGETMAELKKT